MSELPKTYEAKAVESKWTPQWEESGLFTAGQRPDAESWACTGRAQGRPSSHKRIVDLGRCAGKG